jgi:DNA-binding transcriptional LysR family regulator
MNVHHLELFYYVATHGGISAAVRHIPYGIQQPAVSGQMGKLEEDLETKLFERSPFRLTPAGEQLFAHVQPFFDNLGPLKQELQHGEEPELRLGGSEFVLRDHIPLVMQRMKARFPRLRFSMRTGFQMELEDLLRNGELDLAATLVEARPPARLRRLRMVNVPLVLLAHRRSKIQSVEELWAKKILNEPLVGLPAKTILTRNFQRGLKKIGVTWPQTVEAGSIDLTTRYVANGDGFGFNIGIESVVKHKDVRVLPLDGFEPLTMGLVWRGEPTPLVRTAIETMQSYSREAWPDAFFEEPLP